MNEQGFSAPKEMDQAVIILSDVYVKYRRLGDGTTSFKDFALSWIRGSQRVSYFSALNGISLTVQRGETLGIIGDNGAGKSTLLRVLARILKPTSGTALTRGKVTPILELGALFDQELTGRENIYLNGAMLGYSRKVIDTKMEEIVAFSGIDCYIDSPLRTYSSGMIARLAFAISTDIRSDIVLVDEVLAVGDHNFRNKCISRIENIQEGGTTFVMVSHNQDLLTRLCSRVIWLEHGRIIADGDPAEVTALYQNHEPNPLFDSSQMAGSE